MRFNPEHIAGPNGSFGSVVARSLEVPVQIPVPVPGRIFIIVIIYHSFDKKKTKF